MRQVRSVLRCGGVAAFNLNWHHGLSADLKAIRAVFTAKRTYSFSVSSDTGQLLRQVVVAGTVPPAKSSPSAASLERHDLLVRASELDNLVDWARSGISLPRVARALDSR